MVVYQTSGSLGHTDATEILNLNDSTSLPTCLDGIAQPKPIADAFVDAGAFHLTEGEEISVGNADLPHRYYSIYFFPIKLQPPQKAAAT